MSAIEIIPTNNCPVDLPELTERSKTIAAFAQMVHLDLADSKFAPTLSWPYHEGQWVDLEGMLARGEILPAADTTDYEIHLMVNEPLQIGTYMARLGATRIIAHLESFVDERAVSEAFSAWRAGGAREIGLAVLIDTPLSRLDPYISMCNEVMLMSIATLGEQGAAFNERIFPRIAELRARHPDVVIGVDGGVSESNITKLAIVGATRFAVGSAIANSADPAATFARLLSLAEPAV